MLSDSRQQQKLKNSQEVKKAKCGPRLDPSTGDMGLRDWDAADTTFPAWGAVSLP